ncbi:glycosyltransferase [Methylocaldum szegediense]|uniref:glycosyltransferase n=1 Tax=Methylocaldum szegediense TaxID=73780 RepID=UPI00295F2551|nr:glycosyltransferase [Methylocaldum szegediense]
MTIKEKTDHLNQIKKIEEKMACEIERVKTDAAKRISDKDAKIQKRLSDKDAEIQRLKERVTWAENRALCLEQENKAILSSTSWRLTKPLRILSGYIPTPVRGHLIRLFRITQLATNPMAWKARLKQWRVYKVLRASPLFDEAWYLSQYPDVAAAGIDPVRHYIVHGANEGRNPSASFETRFYLDAYPDVRRARVNPLFHYLTAGQQEGRLASRHAKTNKSQIFTGYFDQLTPDRLSGWAVDQSKPGAPVELSLFIDGIHITDIQTSEPRSDLTINGIQGNRAGFTLRYPPDLLHNGANVDLRFKATGQSLLMSPRVVKNSTHQPQRANLSWLDFHRTGQINDVKIIVTIFNAFEAVSECLLSLERTTSPDVEVVLIDDCSTDTRIRDLLSTYANRSRFRIVRNSENIGYTRSINKGIELCGRSDVVLLNSDTVVTDRWLENLRYCAYAHSKVATVTPLSDNAGAFSAPEIGVLNPVPAHLDGSSYARLITGAAKGRLLPVPTGNGFCMYIRRAAFDELGVFDELKYPRGYGEENDFCMRALRKGWQNLVCDKVYVFHKRSKSFGREKIHLMEAGRSQLNKDYPDYSFLTRRFVDLEFSYVRSLARVAATRDRLKPILPRAMYVLSTQTGGTPQTNMDLMRAMEGYYQCFLLRSDSRQITLFELRGDKLETLETYQLSRPIDPVTHRSDEYDRVVLDMLYRYSIELLHIRHIAWHSLGLARAAKSIGIPVVYSFHDFYSLCPSLNLLDENLKFCGGICTSGDGTCQIGLWSPNDLPPVKHRFVFRWREMFSEFIADCDHLITTSQSAAELIVRAYPDTSSKLSIIPHGRDFSNFYSVASLPFYGNKIKVLVPGNISFSKGALLIKEIAELDENKQLEFHFLGRVWDGLRGIGVHHGMYSRNDFSSMAAKISPQLGVILSICPETYCHTLTEMWACGIPVIGLNIGAVGERIKKTGAGWLLDHRASAREILSKILSVIEDGSDYREKLQAVRDWQTSEGIQNNTAAMAQEYRKIYKRVANCYVPNDCKPSCEKDEDGTVASF